MKWSFWSCPQHQRAAIWWGSVALCSIVIGGLLSRCESEPAYADVSDVEVYKDERTVCYYIVRHGSGAAIDCLERR